MTVREMTRDAFRDLLRAMDDAELADLIAGIEDAPTVLDRDEKHTIAMEEARTRPFAMMMCATDQPGASSVYWAIAREAIFGAGEVGNA